MVDFFDRLRKDRKLDESLKLALDIPDAQLKSRLYALLRREVLLGAPPSAVLRLTAPPSRKTTD
jgi:hypothetical protein